MKYIKPALSFEQQAQRLLDRGVIAPDKAVLVSWLHTLNFIRNACAHHARLWNRELPIRPALPDARHRPEWHHPVAFDNRRVFAVLTLLQYLLARIDPQNDWQARL